MIDFGTVRPGSTLYIPFATYDSNDPASSVTLTGLATTDIEIYKDGSTTQRASDAGYTLLDTDGIDFDGVTGIHGFSVDLADNTTAGFYAAGSQYWIVVASVTVDVGTVNFIAATFRIGYPQALLNTTIATYTSPTSFTLTAGPAEDDALNGMACLIHDVASGVQVGQAVILDYTGSTKTVTLAAATTFSIAASDNFSVIGPAPLQPTVAGRTLDVASTGEAGLDFDNILLTNGQSRLGIFASGTLSGTHSSTTADLGTNAPSVDITGKILTVPTHGVSRVIDSYNTGTGIATFSPSTGATLANGDAWYLFDSPLASTSTLPSVTVSSIANNAITAAATATDFGTEIFNAVMTSQLTESYNTDGTAPTAAQALFLIMQMLTERSVSSTTLTVKKLDGSTTAATFTLDSASAPTSVTRAT